MKLQCISPTAHGVLDYLTAAMLPAIPRAFGWNSAKVIRLHDVVAAGTLVTSLATDYPLGVVKVLPLKAHLTLDVLHGGAFLACAALCDDEPDAARMCMASTGLFLLTTGLCTWTQKKEKVISRGSYSGQEPVHLYAKETPSDIYSPQGIGAISGL
jgi:hypothetical protein